MCTGFKIKLKYNLLIFYIYTDLFNNYDALLMHTVLTLIQLTTEYFEKKNIESPRLNAELLLAHVLSCKRLQLYLMFDKPVQEGELTQYRELIKKRGERMPLQYITGEVEFYGLSFCCEPAALIPRSETELLVEKCIEIMKPAGSAKILDIGCGSGNIAISLAFNLPDTSIDALDISGDAIELASRNESRILPASRINFINCDINSFDDSVSNVYDMIVSNPPYVSKEDYSGLQEEILSFEPNIAVTDFGDGYSFYKLISKKSQSLLKQGGYLVFEMAQGQTVKISDMMTENGFGNIEVFKDLQNIDRIIKGTKL